MFSNCEARIADSESLVENSRRCFPGYNTAMETSKKNRNWLWYFLVLAVLTIIATTTLAIYNLRQQLKPEQLDAAIDLWRAKGPAEYVLVYLAKKTEQSGDMEDHYVVKVKGGKAFEVLVNGLPLAEERQLAYYGMHRLLQDIERFMELDAEPGRPKTFTRGDFNGKNGALLRYVRRVMGSRQRLEITVESLELK